MKQNFSNRSGRLFVAAALLGLLSAGPTACNGDDGDDADGAGGSAGEPNESGGTGNGSGGDSGDGSGGSVETTGGTGGTPESTGGLGGMGGQGGASPEASGGASTGGAPSYPAGAFVTTWQTDVGPGGGLIFNLLPLTDETTISLPLVAEGTYDFSVDWGDGSSGTVTSYDDVDRSHSYALPGEYTVVVTGTLEGWHFESSSGGGYDLLTDAIKLVEIAQWGSFGFGTTASTFEYCANLVVSADDVPDLSATTTLAGAFYSCGALEGVPALADWDVSAVTDLSYMFYYATSFDQDLSAWDTSNVTDLSGMFGGATSFNQDLSSWDTSSVTDMSHLFSGAAAFDGDLSGWDTSNVTSLASTFRVATSFNQDLSSWDTSSVTDMSDLFYGATSFNQDLSTWDTSSVTDVSGTFQSATSFDQDLSDWDIGALTQAGSMLDSSALSTENYDALLIGWAGQTTQDDVPFGAGTKQYSAAAQAARGVLTGRGWTITDGGLAP